MSKSDGDGNFRNCLMICGYRGTGKDEIAKKIMGEESKPWIIYCVRDRFDESIKYDRTSFADELKREVSVMLGVPKETSKNCIVNGKTFRHHLIEHGLREKRKDRLVWCKKAQYHTNSVITDWRFPEEYEYVSKMYDNVKTMRVFRSSVENPRVPEENSLDGFLTDYFALSSKSDFNDFMSMFPQYKKCF